MLKTSTIGRKAYIFLNKRWLFDKVYNDFVASKALAFGYHISFKTVDKGFIEILGPTGLMHICTNAVQQLRTLQSGYIYHYALLMLCGASLCVALVSLWDSFSPWVDPRLYGIFVVSFIFYHQTQNQ
jgi:NADH:ubiquinone oxidoreductase subunit 5 (subunit L)/multisubunit Na+/H+ antiporter MnhA subunit